MQLVRRLEDIGGSTPVEMLSLFRALMVDVMYTTIYGEGVGALQEWLVHPTCFQGLRTTN